MKIRFVSEAALSLAMNRRTNMPRLRSLRRGQGGVRSYRHGAPPELFKMVHGHNGRCETSELSTSGLAAKTERAPFPGRMLLSGVSTLLMLATVHRVLAADPLPSWNDTGPKKAIIGFVE